MSRLLLLALTTSTALALTGGIAGAQCAPDNPTAGQTVNCASNDTNGFRDNDANLTIEIDAGVTVSNANTGLNNGDAIRIDGATNIVRNRGVITGADEGLDVRGNGTSVTNFAGASITGADRGLDADGRDGLTVTNGGTITGLAADGGDAIRLRDNGQITNQAGGLIDGADEGIQARDGLNFFNIGNLTADDEGIEARDNATITNTGAITAVDDAIQADDNTTISNSGTIESTENDGIDIDTGAVTNSGTIRSTGGIEDGIDFDPDAANVVSTVENFAGGLIEGAVGINVDPENNRAQQITNAGTIRGLSGVALFLEEGDDALSLFRSGIIDGIADFGAGADVLRLVGSQATLVGGGDLFDGGADGDTLVLEVSIDNLLALAFLPGLTNAFDLSFANSDATVSTLRLANFETFAFNDRIVDLAGLQAAIVPLPATLPLALGALAVFGLLRRRRPSRA